MRRVRHHVNPLRAELLRPRDVGLPLPATGPVEVELGCADARFLFERAPSHPATYFIGLEIREPLVAEVNRKAITLGLDNLRAHYANISVDLEPLFGDGRLAKVFINFPDPWFKRRHYKRRLVNHELVRVLERKLEPGGHVLFQSDVFDLALDALWAFETAGSSLANLCGPWSFCRVNPYGVQSLREVRSEGRGVRVWRIHLIKT
jgi:tRNA (guanine-N7-)-methyltransferase